MKIFQIYFKEDQLSKLDYTPYYNQSCTVFFENSVIRQLIEEKKHLNDDYFGVVSYQLRDKIGIMSDKWKSNKFISNHSQNSFDPEVFEKIINEFKPDAMSFQRHMAHDPVILANKFHPNFSIYYKHIMHKIGYNWEPTHFENVFYCNYFVAKSEIYNKYVTEMLIPAMDVMQNMPELYGNSRYPKKLNDELKNKWGIDHYPYHSFLCERFFSYFAHTHNLNCLHY